MKPAARASVGIIGGRGRTGRQFARLFRAQGFRVQVTGSKDQERNRKLISGCDILVFSLPLSRAAAHITQLAEHATRKDQLVIDVSSLKEHEVRAMMRFPGEVIGMHPLFGPSTDAKGERVILCPARAKQSSVRFLKRFLSRSGISATIMTPREHDELMATVQTIPHLKSFFIADVLRLRGIDLHKTLSLCTPIYEQEFNIVGRFLDDHPDLYVPIIFRNPRILEVLQTMQKVIQEYLHIAQASDFAAAERRYAECKRHFQPFVRRARSRSELCIRALLSSTR